MSKEKAKWRNKKKAIVITLAIVIFLIIAILTGGLIYLHEYCKPKTYQVVSLAEANESNVTLIAHRGFTAVAPENTAPAFEEAGKAGFDGAECDIYRTKDGVWVISHDSHTYRMMDKSSFIEKITYDELMSYTYDNGSNIDKYSNLKVCTLEEYLNICKEYSMTPVIELKGKNNTEHYDEVVNTVKETGMEDNVVFISFHLENLQKLREFSDATLYYLVQKIEDKDIEDALSLGGKCGIDFNGNKEENTSEVIQKCFDKGLLMGAWTIDTEDALNRMINNGVTLITTNTISH